ncbi:MAG: GbsR/MarR family transcriptional regulator [Acidiferrobacterales bacterium]
MKLMPVMEKYVLHWGEMGTRWGVNRTVSQIHALLYLSPEPLSAEDIATTLAVARSNVSTSLRELQSWNLVRVTHAIGDRRDYFEAVKDMWEVFALIVDGRKQREIDPTLSMLRDCAVQCQEDLETDPEIRERIMDVLEFLEVLTGWYGQMQRLPRPALVKLFKMGASIQHFLNRPA